MGYKPVWPTQRIVMGAGAAPPCNIGPPPRRGSSVTPGRQLDICDPAYQATLNAPPQLRTAAQAVDWDKVDHDADLFSIGCWPYGGRRVHSLERTIRDMYRLEARIEYALRETRRVLEGRETAGLINV